MAMKEKKKKVSLSDIAKNIKGKSAEADKPSEVIKAKMAKAEGPSDAGKKPKYASGWSQAKDALLVAGLPTLIGALTGGTRGAAIGAQAGATAFSGYQKEKKAEQAADAKSRAASEDKRFDREIALAKLDEHAAKNKIQTGIMASNMRRAQEGLELQRERNRYARQQALADRRIRAEERAEKRSEKERGLAVPGLGKAFTREDAKKLKSANEMKAKFDRQIGEMIALRENKGAEVLDRASVARGKQLSKDLLLTYKNLAKLGVLSKSDEAIIDAIIPADPLQFDVSSLTGQDPTLHVLKKFKTDLDDDFATTVQQRLQGGADVAENMRMRGAAGMRQGPGSMFVEEANASMMDKNIADYAKKHGLPYDRAEAILRKRGYGQ